LRSPYECLSDVYDLPNRSDGRPAMKFIAEVERLADSVAELVVVGAGQDPVARKVIRVHARRLPADLFRVPVLPSSLRSREGQTHFAA
jgi:hypothetical protein